MSYMVNYEMIATPVDWKSPVPQSVMDDLEAAVEESTCLHEGSYKDGWYGWTNWSSDADDMVKLSIAFPDFVFRLHGEGEASDDMWYEYFCNGKFQFCPVTLVYPDQDIRELTENRANVVYF